MTQFRTQFRIQFQTQFLTPTQCLSRPDECQGKKASRRPERGRNTFCGWRRFWQLTCCYVVAVLNTDFFLSVFVMQFFSLFVHFINSIFLEWISLMVLINKGLLLPAPHSMQILYIPLYWWPPPAWITSCNNDWRWPCNDCGDTIGIKNCLLCHTHRGMCQRGKSGRVTGESKQNHAKLSDCFKLIIERSTDPPPCSLVPLANSTHLPRPHIAVL